MSGVRIDAFGHTDVGQRRESNQDSYLCVPLGPEPWGYVLAVADGMGGHVGGEVAASIAVEVLRETLRKGLGGDPPAGPEELLWGALQRANAEILRRAEADDLAGMGTTMVAALFTESKVWLANVGDSRAYRIGPAGVRQITVDHSWEVEEARRRGLTSEQIASSPFRGALMRSLGTQPAVEVDMFTIALDDEEYLLLCSDGAYRELHDAELEQLRVAADAESGCRRLIEAANQSGGADNITCVVARRRQRRSAGEPAPRVTRPVPALDDGRPATSGEPTS